MVIQAKALEGAYHFSIRLQASDCLISELSFRLTQGISVRLFQNL
jgi:hypothetical protein